MTIINTSPDRPIQLGYEGEDRVTVLRFRYSADWLENGEGIFNIRVRRHGEHTAYNAQLVTEDPEYNCLLMTVTNTELSVKGSGEMQVVYSGADFVKKSPIYSYNVSRAVDEVADPPAQDVYTEIIESLSDLQTDVRQIDGDIADLSELTTAKIGDLTELTTTAKTDLVSAINEVNEHGGGGGGSVTVDSELSTTSTKPVQNNVITARINGLDSDVGTLRTSVQSKADTQTVSALSDAVQGLDGDVQGLQTGLAEKVGDVQIGGTSVVADGVAEIPIAEYGKYGLFKISNLSGLSVANDGSLSVYRATPTEVKSGAVATRYLSPNLSNYSTFYGLAKAAGYDEKNSNLPLGTYSEEAKTAIRTMLGLQEMYEWYKNQT